MEFPIPDGKSPSIFPKIPKICVVGMSAVGECHLLSLPVPAPGIYPSQIPHREFPNICLDGGILAWKKSVTKWGIPDMDEFPAGKVWKELWNFWRNPRNSWIRGGDRTQVDDPGGIFPASGIREFCTAGGHSSWIPSQRKRPKFPEKQRLGWGQSRAGLGRRKKEKNSSRARLGNGGKEGKRARLSLIIN